MKKGKYKGKFEKLYMVYGCAESCKDCPRCINNKCTSFMILPPKSTGHYKLHDDTGIICELKGKICDDPYKCPDCPINEDLKRYEERQKNNV